MLRIVEYGAGGPLLDDAAVAQHQRAAGQRAHEGQVVRHEQNRQVVVTTKIIQQARTIVALSTFAPSTQNSPRSKCPLLVTPHGARRSRCTGSAKWIAGVKWP